MTDVDDWRWISLSVDLQVGAGSLCVHLSNDADQLTWRFCLPAVYCGSLCVSG